MASYDSPTGELTLAEPTSRKVEFRFCKEWYVRFPILTNPH